MIESGLVKLQNSSAEYFIASAQIPAAKKVVIGGVTS